MSALEDLTLFYAVNCNLLTAQCVSSANFGVHVVISACQLLDTCIVLLAKLASP